MRSIRIACAAISLLCIAAILVSGMGVFALWLYSDGAPAPVVVPVSTSVFEYVEMSKLYISAVEVHAQGGAIGECEIIYPTALASSLQVSGRSASITYKITVRNESDMTYWYLGPNFDRTHGQNSLIGISNGIFISTRDLAATSSDSFDTSDWIPPQTERVFYATYTFGANAQGALSLLVDFTFGLHMGSVSDAFLKVLNDKNSEYGYSYLSGSFNDKYAESGSTVLANVGGEAEIFNNLFGANLTVNVDGVDKPATIVIERRDVDNKSATGDAYSGAGAPLGCEYTVYVTVDSLTGGAPTVYALSYTCGADGTWYQIGELYEGTCTVIPDYDSETAGQQPAPNVGEWKASAKTYEVTPDISYKVGYEQGQTEDKYNTIEELMSMPLGNFFNTVNNNSGKLLKPVCTTVYSYTPINGRWEESVNAANQHKPGYEQLKAAFDAIKPHCFINNGGFERLEDANSLTRAELIQLLEAVQHAYDYYLSLNPNG